MKGTRRAARKNVAGTLAQRPCLKRAGEQTEHARAQAKGRLDATLDTCRGVDLRCGGQVPRMSGSKGNAVQRRSYPRNCKRMTPLPEQERPLGLTPREGPAKVPAQARKPA
jgi:hypothetical protein